MSRTTSAWPSTRYSITRTRTGGALTVPAALLCLFASIRAGLAEGLQVPGGARHSQERSVQSEYPHPAKQLRTRAQRPCHRAEQLTHHRPAQRLPGPGQRGLVHPGPWPESRLTSLHQPQHLKVIRLREETHGEDEVHGEPRGQQPAASLLSAFVPDDPVHHLWRAGLGQDPQPQPPQPRYQHTGSTGRTPQKQRHCHAFDRGRKSYRLQRPGAPLRGHQEGNGVNALLGAGRLGS